MKTAEEIERKLRIHIETTEECIENFNLDKTIIEILNQELELLKYVHEYFTTRPTLPSDEVEFALKLNKYIHEQCIDGTPHDIGWNVMKLFSARIAEMERELKKLKALNQQYSDFRKEVIQIPDELIKEIDDKHFPF